MSRQGPVIEEVSSSSDDEAFFDAVPKAAPGSSSFPLPVLDGNRFNIAEVLLNGDVAMLGNVRCVIPSSLTCLSPSTSASTTAPFRTPSCRHFVITINFCLILTLISVEEKVEEGKKEESEFDRLVKERTEAKKPTEPEMSEEAKLTPEEIEAVLHPYSILMTVVDCVVLP